jgi:TolA-binding protein
MTEPQRLVTYVQPVLSEARIQAQWSRIAGRRPARVSLRGWWYVGGAVAAAAMAVLVIGLLHRAEVRVQASEQILVERDAQGLESLTFPEGLVVSLHRQARYRVLERSNRRVHLQLEQGTAEFEVTPGRDRQVVVTAAGIDVEVVGTRFEVSLLGDNDKPDVAVRVLRGTVRVRPRDASVDQGRIRTLSAGQAWATGGETAEVPRAALTENTPRTPESNEPAAAVSAVPQAAPSALSAKELFELGEANRLKGRSREAAVALDRLRHMYPRDPRSGLASFELGRLRMDQFGDSAGALDAFSDALRLDPSARFREDAEARIVRLYAKLGSIERCLKAQAEYQSRYPNGPHARMVAGSCAR